MVSVDYARRDVRRLMGVLVLMLCGLVFLGVMLWRIQVLHVRRYESSFERQSIRRARLPGVRGMIFDRSGECLAGNRPSYCVAVYIEELRQAGPRDKTIDEIERIIDRVADILGRERTATREDIRRHIHQRSPLPFIAWRDLTHEELAVWEQGGAGMRGVDIYVEPVRTYPHGALAAHAIGHVTRVKPVGPGEQRYQYYLPELDGKDGVERAFNSILAGEAGGRLIRVDAAGYKHTEKCEKEPEAGNSIMLTIDVRIQAMAEQVLTGERGATVVLDPRNGDVLALASSPAFDLRNFTPSVSAPVLRRLRSDRGSPFLNRAIAGRYAAGSIFKPIVAIAALENRRATADTKFSCPGHFDLGNTRFHCWNSRGHGSIAMREAIEQSCNSYFCQLGLKCGYERIYHMAEALGLGAGTGIDLPGEASGLLPDNEWKVRRHSDLWRSGDTCNVSIGQGPLVVTPIQMAVFASAVANGGYVYRPRLLLRKLARGVNPYHFSPPSDGDHPRKGELMNWMQWSSTTLKLVRGGMLDVVQNRSGTGLRARVAGVRIGGKTGTAEYGPRSARKKYAWMIAFAPFERPRYAAVIVVEDALSGGRDAAPRMARLLKGILVRDGVISEEDSAG